MRSGFDARMEDGIAGSTGGGLGGGPEGSGIDRLRVLGRLGRFARLAGWLALFPVSC